MTTTSLRGITEADFGGETRRFLLRNTEIDTLQDLRASGAFNVCKRLAQGDWFTQDVREVLRLGLEGCGTPPNTALHLVRRYVDEFGVANHTALAFVVLDRSLWMPEGVLRVGKEDGEAETTATATSTSPESEPTPS